MQLLHKSKRSWVALEIFPWWGITDERGRHAKLGGGGGYSVMQSGASEC